MTPTRIVIFAKAPIAGRVKTRLIPALGEEGAAQLAQEMLTRTLAEALASGLAVELCGDPHPKEWGELLPPGPFRASAQGEGVLGTRLARAAERVIAGGENVLLVGADCPELDRERLGAAAAALVEHHAAIHPAQDGGYALLGLSRFDPSVFQGIAWSTERVAAQTLERIATLGWSVHVGPTLADIDEPSDLGLLAPSPMGERVGVRGSDGGKPLRRP